MRVIGHGLQDEGAAYSSVKCTEKACAKIPTVKRVHQGIGGDGHALCACGAQSEHLHSGHAREAWHREHKAEVADKPA